jgi:antitoxin (DNA-binding transcriptional repressor) of toxin-antitoxin stability system
MDELDCIGSAEMRKSAITYMRRVARTGTSIEIEHHGKVVAQLTTDPGEHSTPSLPLTPAALRAGWQGYIEAVSVRKARYVFTVAIDDEDVKVYLRPLTTKFSARIREWNEHVSEYREQQTGAERLAAARDLEATVLERISVLEKLIGELSQQAKIVFARMERGDLMKCPELGTQPLRSRDDLERFEVD